MDNKEDILKLAKRLRAELIPHIGATSLEILDGIIKEVVKLRKQIPKDDSLSMKAWKIHFDSVWAEYPQKIAKHAAWLHFKAQVKTPEDLANIRKALDNYKANMAQVRIESPERQWLHGSTWFNRRWEDFIDYQAPAQLAKPPPAKTKQADPIPEEDLIDPGKLQGLLKNFNRTLKSAPRASNKFVEQLK